MLRFWRMPAGFVGGVVVGLLLGFAVPTAIVVGVAAGAVLVMGTRVATEIEPGWERERHVRKDGTRGELQEVAWAMVGRDGRLSERTLRRVREVAAHRLARHGLDLDAPEQAAETRDLVGRRAYATLTRTSGPAPTVADLRHTLEVLERLGTRPTTSTTTSTTT